MYLKQNVQGHCILTCCPNFHEICHTFRLPRGWNTTLKTKIFSLLPLKGRHVLQGHINHDMRNKLKLRYPELVLIFMVPRGWTLQTLTSLDFLNSHLLIHKQAQTLHLCPRNIKTLRAECCETYWSHLCSVISTRFEFFNSFSFAADHLLHPSSCGDLTDSYYVKIARTLH